MCRLRTFTCIDDVLKLQGDVLLNESGHIVRVCVPNYDDKICGREHRFSCIEDYGINRKCLYNSWEFWYFILLMSIGTVAFNIINSISDAICFDVIGMNL